MEYKPKIAVVVSHPIQHFCPQYVSFAENDRVEFKVFFGSALGYKKYTDKNFGKEISWSNLNLDKFDHVFLNGDAVLQSDKNLDAESLEPSLQEYNPDLVVIYGYFQKMQRKAHDWAIRNKIKLAYISDSELRHKRNRLKELVKYLFIRSYFKGINYFLTVGNANEDFYRHFGVNENRFIRMHFPIDIIQYERSYTERELLRKATRAKYNIANDEIVLSMVGKLTPWKNHDHIIDAMLLLEQEGIYTKLFVLGSGEKMNYLQEKAAALKKSTVIFTGFVNIEALPGYYAATDIYVHAASIEPHSIAVSEAIYMGCPVVISDTCGSYGDNDDVQEGRNGYVYEFGNIPELAKKIRMLLKHISAREQFGSYSHNIAAGFQEYAHKLVLNALLKRIAE